MTFPCKEEFVYLERNVSPRQHRIYPDACDHGIFEDEIDIEKTRKAVNELIKCYKSAEYRYYAQKGYNWKEVSFNIPIEMDEGHTIGYKVHIGGAKGPSVKRPFITIHISHCVLSR